MSSSGLGKSATCVNRMIAISAAIIALGADETSSIAFNNICHIRVIALIGRSDAAALPRSRSSGDTVGSSTVWGEILITEIQCVISAKSRNIAKGSAPSAY